MTSKLEAWYAGAKDSAACRLAQEHVDGMVPVVRHQLEASMQCPPGEERLALLFALTCRADELAAIPLAAVRLPERLPERVSHIDVLALRRD